MLRATPEEQSRNKMGRFRIKRSPEVVYIQWHGIVAPHAGHAETPYVYSERLKR